MKNLMEWLTEERKLDEALLLEMGVKETTHPRIGPAVAFPYKRAGESYAAKFRSENKQWASSAGVSRGIYNEDALAENFDLPVIITEGEMDCLTTIQAGYPRSVSLPDGWTADGGKRECLIREEARLRNSPFVVVAGDNDEAGASLPRAVANILAGHDVRYVTWPDGCKDANDVLMARGEAEIVEAINAAKMMDPEGGFITGISDLPPLPARRVLKAGVSNLDYRLAFEVGALSVGTGVPGHGKSTLTTFAAYHVAMNERVRVGFMSFETHPHRTRDHLARLMTGKPWGELSAQDKAETAKRLDERFRIVHRTFEETTHNLGWLREMIYTLAVRDGCKLIVIDPWNELEHLPETGESMTAYINFALQQMRQWAEQYDTHICLVAHPKKINDGDRAPVGYDVADSAAFSNKPALGFTVHQKQDGDGYHYVELTTWKVRDTQLYGMEKGFTKLDFHIDQMSYSQHPNK